MARILKIKQNAQKISAHKVDNGVDCQYQVIHDADGAKLVHLSTFGSKQRVSHPKSSQSLQVDQGVAATLVKILSDAFGIASSDLDQVLVDSYRENPDKLRAIISNDEASRDVIAMAHRRSQVERFRKLLSDSSYFSSEAANLGNHGDEKVWQNFFEENPWIFGVSLSGQLLTSWNSEKLEQVVAGSSIVNVGKRVDALLKTSGRIKSLVFAEIKTHDMPLLGSEPRSGCWSPSRDLVAGVAQAQGTVHEAIREIGDRLEETSADGDGIPGEYAYLLRPRSYLVVGNLNSLVNAGGGHNKYKFRSFELFRRELVQPEVLTFDELLARAEWIVESDDAGSV
ncbi:Shedu immune nuclease family protein [Nocardia miyunensis]|uniref:Shedu immune nuclease family protein n=1 Tax=Nocardia miyunensis TaxID=282684 RepID=UPI000A69B9BE|nr:Shedu immune nuclease family protein [Nocardia miyunensis]